MNQTFEDRMQSIEDQLKEIRKELEESLARYKVSLAPPKKPSEPAIRRVVNEKVINKNEIGNIYE